MAKYTTQIRSIVESDYPLFDFEYPIFDEAYKPVLEKKIIDHYYFREIGLETVGQFKHFLKARLNVIMPYYNEHYLALKVFKTYDPYVNKDMTTTETRTSVQDSESDILTSAENKSLGTGKSETVANGTANDTTETTEREIFSDTPQAALQGKDYATNLTDKTGTATNNAGSESTQVTDTTQDTTDTATGTAKNTGLVTTTDEYIQTIQGFDGMKYASDVYLGVKETIMNIDAMIISELSDLFMNIY